MSVREKKDKEATQKQRFIDKARELGCDEDPKAFERTFTKIVPKRPLGTHPRVGKGQSPSSDQLDIDTCDSASKIGHEF